MPGPYQFFVTGILALACVVTPRAPAQSSPLSSGDDWPYYGHDAGGMRYSPLAQINRENVASLKVAWTFHVGDIPTAAATKNAAASKPRPSW